MPKSPKFGYPGGAVMPIFDAIYQSTDFDFILPRHEQGAGHMAEGYARATGKPGIVLVTSGPGATNTVTALNNAFKDGTPLLVFSGQVPTDAVGSDAFQEMDIVSITRPCTKWSAMVTDIKFLPQYISHAFNVATSGRPGPVLLDMPKDITAATIQEPICLPKLSSAVEEENPEDSLDRHIKKKLREETIQRCAQLINQSQKPVIYAGQGVVSSALGPTLLRQLADKACIPVTTTLLGLGAFDEFDVKSLHMLGMHGAAYANQAMQKADLIIALGARFDERVTGNVAKFAPAAKAAAAAGKGGIVHFDISPKQINRVVHATEGVEGDIQESLTDLLPFFPTAQNGLTRSKSGKKRHSLLSLDTHHKALSNEKTDPQVLIERLSQMTHHLRDETIITTGVGQHQMWVAQHYKFTPSRRLIASGGAGTMGFGLPAAIGAKLAYPESLVIDIDGDASFNMTLAELSTAVQYNLGVKVLLLNNGEQGMITQLQNMFYKKRYCHATQKNPDYVALAVAMGVAAQQLSDYTQIDEKLQWLLDTEGPALLDVIIEPNMPLWPMVIPGASLDEMFLSDKVQMTDDKK
ncbi:Acetolactate synthase [Penicillium atrosanguineum]|nr:Acetolactate synthase [Penicillium atrosanguineum]